MENSAKAQLTQALGQYKAIPAGTVVTFRMNYVTRAGEAKRYNYAGIFEDGRMWLTGNLDGKRNYSFVEFCQLMNQSRFVNLRVVIKSEKVKW